MEICAECGGPIMGEPVDVGENVEIYCHYECVAIYNAGKMDDLRDRRREEY